MYGQPALKDGSYIWKGQDYYAITGLTSPITDIWFYGDYMTGLRQQQICESAFPPNSNMVSQSGNDYVFSSPSIPVFILSLVPEGCELKES